MQRAYLRKLPDHMFQRWGCANALGIGKGTFARWLRQAKFVNALECQQIAERAKSDVSATRIVKHTEAIAFLDTRRLYHADGTRKKVIELDADVSCTVLEVDTEGYPIKFEPRRHARESLERMHNLAPQRHEFTGKDGAPLMPEPQLNEIAIARRLAFLLARGEHAMQDA
jgi:hypothetical protein